MVERKRRDSGKGRRGERKPFLLRLSPELMDELKVWSSQELRSLNGHIEYLLRAAVNQKRRRDGASYEYSEEPTE